jgi:cobalamin synthase
MKLMNAQQLISMADALRSHALQMGHDLNASNMFVHTMLMRALHADGVSDHGDGLGDLADWSDM